MPVAGLGTDLVHVPRFRRFVAEGKTALLERLFTLGERTYALSKKDPAPHLAARFAAKEATIKALGDVVHSRTSRLPKSRSTNGPTALRSSGPCEA